MIVKTIFGAVADWWRDLYALALVNLLWFVLLIPVVTAPPATAALMSIAREVMLRNRVAPLDIFRQMRPFFLRSWILGLLFAVGVVVGIADMAFFGYVVEGWPSLIGFLTIFYIILLWLQFHYYCWAMMVLRPDLTLRAIMRNSFILTMRRPLFNIVITIVALILVIASLIITPLIALVTAAICALISVRGLAITTPELLYKEDRKRLEELAEADAAADVVPTRGRDE